MAVTNQPAGASHSISVCNRVKSIVLSLQQFPSGPDVGHLCRDSIFHLTDCGCKKTHRILIVHVGLIGCRYLHLAAYRSDVGRCVVLMPGCPAVDVVCNRLATVHLMVILQQPDQRTIPVRHVFKLFKRIVFLCRGRDFSLPVCCVRVPYISGVAVSYSAWLVLHILLLPMLQVPHRLQGLPVTFLPVRSRHSLLHQT
nr:MAG TPA: hypothetical protein [Caudoviricetes sp.]